MLIVFHGCRNLRVSKHIEPVAYTKLSLSLISLVAKVSLGEF